MPRVDALADGVHDRVGDVLAAGRAVAGPVGELHRRVLLPARTPAGRLPADPSPLGEGTEDHDARELQQLLAERRVGTIGEVIQ